MIVDILYFRLHEFIPSMTEQSPKSKTIYALQCINKNISPYDLHKSNPNFERWESVYRSEYGPTLWLSSGMIV